MSDITLMLAQIDRGDRRAAAELLPLVYDELRRLAAARLAHESPGQTLQATALVHEAYLRLVGQQADAERWNDRRHFFAAAAEAMRRILVDNARQKRRLKRGGECQRQEYDEDLALQPDVDEDLLALDAALTKLQATDRPAAELVELRYFAGLTQAEAAAALGLAPRSADRLWAYAKAWLHRELQGSRISDADA